MAIRPRPSVEHFSSGASSSGWITRKYSGVYEFCRVAMNHLTFSIKEFWQNHLRGQQQRQGKEDRDDGPVNDVVPALVYPAFAEQFVIVEQQLKKNDGRRKNDAGENLHADDDQLQGNVRNKNDRCGGTNTGNVGSVETRSLPEFLVKRVLPSLHLAIGPGTGERN